MGTQNITELQGHPVFYYIKVCLSTNIIFPRIMFVCVNVTHEGTRASTRNFQTLINCHTDEPYTPYFIFYICILPYLSIILFFSLKNHCSLTSLPNKIRKKKHLVKDIHENHSLNLSGSIILAVMANDFVEIAHTHKVLCHRRT